MTSWPRRVARDGASLTGSFLLFTSTVDRVVDEKVVVAEPDPDPTVAQPTVIATLESTGNFRSGAHMTRGTASLVRTPDGKRLLTLTGFSAAPGPDLRVYLVPGRTGVDRALDLGGLKATRASNSTSFRGRRASDPLWSGAAPSASSSAPAYCTQPTSSAEFLSASGNPTRMAVGSAVGDITPRDA